MYIVHDTLYILDSWYSIRLKKEAKRLIDNPYLCNSKNTLAGACYSEIEGRWQPKPNRRPASSSWAKSASNFVASYSSLCFFSRRCSSTVTLLASRDLSRMFCQHVYVVLASSNASFSAARADDYGSRHLNRGNSIRRGRARYRCICRAYGWALAIEYARLRPYTAVGRATLTRTGSLSLTRSATFGSAAWVAKYRQMKLQQALWST